MMSRDPDAHDREIDDLLRALGGHQPAPGLEQRVLHRLAQARAAQAGADQPRAIQPGRSPRPRVWLWSAGLLAFASSTAVLLLLSVPHARPHAAFEAVPTQTIRTAQPAASAGNATVEPRVPLRIPLPLQARHVPPREHLAPPAAGLPSTQLISFPAPPLPLTEQERLLLRIAHRHDPQQVAALDPVTQDRLNIQESIRFEQFFTPPTVPVQSLVDPPNPETPTPAPAPTPTPTATPTGDPQWHPAAY